MIELLSPVGDFECLKAAVQNGADTVYFGSSSFSARAFASNFSDDDLKKAICYPKIRGVKTNLTLNTLLKNNELPDAIALAEKAYNYGIDAIIVQDLGLARYLIKNFPGLAVHASTQLSVHNLDGVLELQKLGFSRVVLSRELSLQEIEYICKNSDVEIEVFVHGALCISYSGQCLFSSMVGGRSGNRGKCAQPCRLPYELLCSTSDTDIDINTKSISNHNNDKMKSIDKGYLLSPRDLCGLDYLADLVKAGISCLKIEGRMKTPEYVATVTRIYRKYLDLAINSSSSYKIETQDKQDLLQVFNRGGFSTGHLSGSANRDLVYPDKSNNMGIFLGNVSNFNNNKGHITFTTNASLKVGDTIAIENRKHETSLYTISELMLKDKNIPQANVGDKIKIGRMKGDIFVGNKIYKMSDKSLTKSALDTLDKELRKTDLSCKLNVLINQPISLTVFDKNGITVFVESNNIPEPATNSPITKERLIAQLSKTNNTPFNFKNIDIDLDDGLFIKGISCINELRRRALAEYEEKLINSFSRCLKLQPIPAYTAENSFSTITPASKPLSQKSISLLLNLINPDFDYSNLKNIDKIYIPFKYFILTGFESSLYSITNKFDTYIYLPTIIKNNYNKLIKTNLSNILKSYNIKGFVVSNIGNFELLKNYKNYEFICNCTFNLFNNLSITELPCNTITLSPELNKLDLQEISYNRISNSPKTELIVYGRTPLMNSNYCLLGKSNKCYTSCKHLCNSTSSKFFLKDRLGFLFRVIPDNIDTVTTIYNSKITSIEHKDIWVDSVRIDALDESIDELNFIIDTVKSGKKLEGSDYTNGNFNRDI
mgnify:CR=1 FL=1